jgi:hypothetical protein
MSDDDKVCRVLERDMGLPAGTLALYTPEAYCKRFPPEDLRCCSCGCKIVWTLTMEGKTVCMDFDTRRWHRCGRVGK